MEAMVDRPDLDLVVVAATGEIERLRECFTSRSFIAWAEPDATRGPEEDSDDDQRTIRQHRSRSLWDRLGGQALSRSREPDRSRSWRSRKLGEWFKKPFSPASLRVITMLVEKDGCKSICLRAAKKKVTVAPA
ncbi:hypothetical protein E2562_018619 [Oryza meyeriana var. granulata]|uniref:Uncharacterized protein n=1 Tax=Oryza meyeriana var. granulata TaxID=110450 RepID=A0A6G1BWX5_9ORYZ|nr:hypothetical protein E2562_018619 [Oryza meyeriana var. granulata]